MVEPVDKSLYEKIKKSVYKKNPIHSAYRSGAVVKEYKKVFASKYGSAKSPYKGGPKPKNSGLSRWL